MKQTIFTDLHIYAQCIFSKGQEKKTKNVEMQEGASRFPVCHLLPIELEKIQQNYEWEASQFTSFIFYEPCPFAQLERCFH